MKTNVVLRSDADRELFGLIIRQETKTGFLCLSDLQEAYTVARVRNGWMKKNIPEILQGKENVERIFYVLKEQGVITIDFSMFIEQVEKQGIVTTLKRYKVYRTSGARHTKTIWCHDSIWILLSLELSPIFYAKTVMWLRDELVRNRIEAGNFCRTLNSSIQRFHPTSEHYIQLAKALNYVTFGRHEAGIRNTGSKEQLRELRGIEEAMALNIDLGMINSLDELLTMLRKIFWRNHPTWKHPEESTQLAAGL